MTSIPDGDYFIFSKSSGKCINVKGQSRDEGAKMVQYQMTHGTNQQFRVAAVDGKDGYATVECLDSQLYWAIENKGTAVNDNLVQAEYSTDDNHLFLFAYTANGVYSIVNKHSQLELAVFQSENGNNVDIVQFTRNSNWNQRWFPLSPLSSQLSSQLKLNIHLCRL